MLETLTGRFAGIVKSLRGQARLTDANVKDTLREVRVALLEADVALPVVKEFIDRVREKAIGESVLGSLTPGQAFVGVVREELTALMGAQNDALDLAVRPPAVVLMAGLQGSGKTTTSGKLARLLSEQKRIGKIRWAICCLTQLTLSKRRNGRIIQLGNHWKLLKICNLFRKRGNNPWIVLFKVGLIDSANRIADSSNRPIKLGNFWS